MVGGKGPNGSFEGLLENYIMAGIDCQANTENLRNLCSEPVTTSAIHSYSLGDAKKVWSNLWNTNDINTKNRSMSKSCSKMETKNKNIWGTKLVRKLICFPNMLITLR